MAACLEVLILTSIILFFLNSDKNHYFGNHFIVLFCVLAKIDDYILEKSRVVHRSSGEKNFHVFYALFAGMSRERLLYYFLEDPDCHR